MSYDYEPKYYPTPVKIELDNEVMYVHSLGHVDLTNDVGRGGSSSWLVTCHPEQAKVYRRTTNRGPGGTELHTYTSIFDDSEPLSTARRKTVEFIGYFVVMRIEGIASGKRVFDKDVYGGDEGVSINDEQAVKLIKSANRTISHQYRQQHGNQQAA